MKIDVIFSVFIALFFLCSLSRKLFFVDSLRIHDQKIKIILQSKDLG